MHHWKKFFMGLILTLLVSICCSEDNVFAANTKIPILMYHNIVEDGETNSMTITLERFRQDMQYLSQQGYTALTPADLINIRAGTVKMPLKPVMITFDDGYESNYTLAFPVLKQYGVRATISLITSDIRDGNGNGLDWFMTWDQAREMYASGIITFGSHTHNLHNPQNGGLLIKNGVNGIQRLKNENWAQYQKRVGQDIQMSINLIEKNIPGMHVQYFSYPFGETDEWIGKILLQNHIYVTTTTKPRIADIRKGLYGLTRYRITMDLPVSALLARSAVVSPTMTQVTIQNASAELPSYEIGGRSFVRLRDFAALASQTAVSFSVDWDEQTTLISLYSGQNYLPNGAERQPLPEQKQIARSMQVPVILNGEKSMLAAYIVDAVTFIDPEKVLPLVS